MRRCGVDRLAQQQQRTGPLEPDQPREQQRTRGFRHQAEAGEWHKNRADCAAITRSACASIVVPTPIAAPFTAATSGFVSDDSAVRNGEAWRYSASPPVPGNP